MIDTVLFDMGGTLENVVHDEETLTAAANKAIEILRAEGVELGLETSKLARMMEDGFLRYKEYQVGVELELKPERIWNEYILEPIKNRETFLNDALCERLAHMWEITYYRRELREGVVEMLEGLKSLNMRMGIISNTASLFQVFAVLEEYGIRDYFEDVTLSSIVGYRKPDRRIFDIALRQMQADAKKTAYAGDTLARDVIGARNAGLAKTFRIQSFLSISRDQALVGSMRADHEISSIMEIYEILRDQSEA
ncbi:HAD family hydrolase [Eubacteriales bacterium OttesenSCG-928-K08]|nr:HAD family hydrolase [Eubacteriales bacterium OttesenSCG-928-K08]